MTDKKQIANEFNEYFSRIGLETSQSVLDTTNSFKTYMPDPFQIACVLNQCQCSPLKKHLRNLNLKIGVDIFTNSVKIKFAHIASILTHLESKCLIHLSTKLLKETINIVGTPLTHQIIINRSFDTGIVPSQLKTAKVIPIFKANDSNLLKNYRPVSLLPAFQNY